MLTQVVAAQDDQVGNVSFSVVLSVGELLKQVISEGMHPAVIAERGLA